MKKGIAARAGSMCIAGGIIAFIAGVFAVSLGLQYAWFGIKTPPSETAKVIEIISRPLTGHDYALLIPGAAGIVSGFLGIAGGIICRKNKNTGAAFAIAAAVLSLPDFFVVISISSIILFIIAAKDLIAGREEYGEDKKQAFDEY